LASPMLDQAEGLRRMFAGDVRRMIGILSEHGSAGGHVLATNLATTLGATGKKVLLLDENLVAGEVHPVFAVNVVCDLFQVLRDKVDMASALIEVAPSVDLLAGGLVRMVRRPEIKSHTDFINAFYRLAGVYDVVLINAAEEGASSYPSLTWAAQDIIVLCGDRTDSVTTAYARIKALRQAGERRFHMLFEQMPIERAQMLYRNLATVSRRHLQEIPGDLGILPQDATEVFFAMLADSVQDWPLPEHKRGHFRAFMQRLLQGSPSIPRAALRSS
jgi:flagellar biosynthesis protein FlhG